MGNSNTLDTSTFKKFQRHNIKNAYVTSQKSSRLIVDFHLSLLSSKSNNPILSPNCVTNHSCGSPFLSVPKLRGLCILSPSAFFLTLSFFPSPQLQKAFSRPKDHSGQKSQLGKIQLSTCPFSSPSLITSSV